MSSSSISVGPVGHPIKGKSYKEYSKQFNWAGGIHLNDAPQGSQGATGPQGSQGATGPQGSSINSLQYSINMDRTNFPNPFTIAGVDPNVPQVTSQQTDYTTDFSVRNNHIYITVNSITSSSPGNCTIEVTGDAISESSSVPDINVTETITFTPSSGISYQTLKKWLKVSKVSVTHVGSNISTINYDIRILGYVDFLNTNVKIIGYRAEILGDLNATKVQVTFTIIKIKQDGPVTSLINLEDITIDANDSNTSYIIDNLRTGLNNRDYTVDGLIFWKANSVFVLKQTDFNTYFTNNENEIDSSNNEGIIIQLKDDIGEPNGARYINLQLYYE